jgi:hypothetical protein
MPRRPDQGHPTVEDKTFSSPSPSQVHSASGLISEALTSARSGSAPDARGLFSHGATNENREVSEEPGFEVGTTFYFEDEQANVLKV